MDDLQNRISVMQREIASLRRDYQQARQAAIQGRAEAQRKNAELAAERAAWTNLLREALRRDSAIDLDSLKRATPKTPPFAYARPSERDYLPEQPARFGGLMPGKRRVWQAETERARQKFRDDFASWRDARDKHDQIRRERQDDVRRWNADIERFQREYAAGEAHAIVRYCHRVLAAAEYPPAYAPKAELAYSAESKRLTVEIDLPAYAQMPAIREYRYQPSSELVVERKAKPKQRRKFYAAALAQICLRILREIFEADRGGHIAIVALNGYVDAIDRSTGRRIRPCLLSVRAEREQFLSLNLAQVDARLCLRKTLKARFSRDAAKLLPVEPLPADATEAPQRESSLQPQEALEAMMRQLETTSEAASQSPAEAVPAADESSVLFVPVEIDEGAEAPLDVPIPPPPPAEPSRPIAPVRGDFFGEMRAYADRVEDQAEPAPFKQYYPKYENMSEAQLRWHFFWRSRYRDGQRLPTDLSYIYLHVYEIINLVGVESPSEAVDYLAALWRHYRAAHGGLDKYLPAWIADLIVIHKLAPDALAWYGEVAALAAAGDIDLLVQGWVNAGADMENIADELLFQLANYNPRKSKFYRQHDAPHELREALKRGLVAFDAAIRSEQGNSLFEACREGGARVIRRKPFAEALYADSADEIAIGETHAWRANKNLNEMLRDVLRHSENTLRGQNNYNYRLRGIRLSDERKAVITAALTPEKPKPEVVIDHSIIDQIRQQSDAFRDQYIALENDAIAAEDDSAETEAPPHPAPVVDDESVSLPSRLTVEPAPTVDVAQAAEADNGARPGYLRRPPGTAAHLLTDLEEVAEIIGENDSDSAKLLRLLMQGNWQCEESAVEFEFAGRFVSTIFDELNDRAHNHIEENLISLEESLWVVEEDYRDEVEHILTHPDFKAYQALGNAVADE